MCTILIHEPEAVISLDLATLLKDNIIIKTTTVYSLLKVLRTTSIDILILDINRMLGWKHLAHFLTDHNIPVIILSTARKKFLKFVSRSKCRIIELPFNSADIIKAVELYKQGNT